MAKKLLITIVEAGEMLAVSRATIYKLISAGKLRSIKLGRSCRLPVVEVERYLTELAKAQHGDLAVVGLSFEEALS